MKLDELEGFLTRITPSEQRHLDHPDKLSPHYRKIQRVAVDGVEMYNFSFYNAMGDNDIWLMKESRFCPIPLHVHEVVELSYVYRGACRQIIDGTPVELHAGDFCLLGRNTPQEILPLGPDDIVITIDMRERYLIENLLKRLSSRELVTQFLARTLAHNVTERRYLIFELGDDIMLRQLMQQLICAYYSEHIYQEILNAYLIIVFSRLMRLTSDGSEAGLDGAEATVVEVLHYIDQHADATLNEIAARLGYSPAYLGALIKQKTGHTYRELVLRQRMKTAADALATTDVPVYEIAEAVGYQNLSFFYKKFESVYSCTPQTWRTEHRTAHHS